MLSAGVIGLGQIGGGVAICLARSGQLRAVYDIRPEAAAAVLGGPANAASPRQLAQACDVVLIAVMTAAQARSVLEGPEGVLAAARPGLSVALLSTVSLDDLAELAALCARRGVELVDCGVTGGPAAARNGLVCLVGCSDEAFARVLPVLDGFAKSVMRMGGPGSGMTAKICRNIIAYGIWLVGSESMKLARAAGIDVRQLAEAVRASGPESNDPVALVSRPDPAQDAGERRMRKGLTVLLEKDLAAAKALADSLGVDLPVTDLTLAAKAQIAMLE